MITTAHAHKSGVIFSFFPRAVKQKKIKALRLKMTKIASRGSCLKPLNRWSPKARGWWPRTWLSAKIFFDSFCFLDWTWPFQTHEKLYVRQMCDSSKDEKQGEKLFVPGRHLALLVRPLSWLAKNRRQEKRNTDSDYVMRKPSRCWLGNVPRHWNVVASCFTSLVLLKTPLLP